MGLKNIVIGLVGAAIISCSGLNTNTDISDKVPVKYNLENKVENTYQSQNYETNKINRIKIYDKNNENIIKIQTYNSGKLINEIDFENKKIYRFEYNNNNKVNKYECDYIGNNCVKISEKIGSNYIAEK